MVTFSKYMARTLADYGVKSFFTIPGSSCIRLNNALNDMHIFPVLCRSEESAAHAAHGYAAVTESFGCAVVSRGPAATNTITGLVTACEGYPILVIVGDNALDVRQKHVVTQDLPLEKIFEGVCECATLTKPDDIGQIVDDVMHKLTVEKISCVLIVPSDIWSEQVDITKPSIRKITKKRTLNTNLAEAYIQKFPPTDKNLLLLGSGILNNSHLRRIAKNALKKYNVPFLVSTQGLGYPSPQRTGWIGAFAEPDSNKLLYESEHLIILDEFLGSSTTGAMSDFQYGRKITTIRVNSSRQSNFMPNIDIHIDAEDLAAFLDILLKRMNWMSRISDKGVCMPKPEIILEGVLRQIPDTCIVCLDSGQNFFWAAHSLLRVNKHRIIYSYTQATMGFGLPALLGVSSANPHSSLLICGDGGFHMAIEELATIYSAGFKSKIIILNNSMLGMVYQTQKMKGLPKLAVDVKIHNLKKIVEGYGWEYISISDTNDAAIKNFLESENNCVLDIQVDQDECVYPRGSGSERLPTV